MSDITNRGASYESARPVNHHRHGPRRRSHHPWHIALVALWALLGLVLGAAAGACASVRHEMRGDASTEVAHLTGAVQSAGQTILFTAAQVGPTAPPVLDPDSASNFFILVHINANGQAGGAVTLPGDMLVNVPGNGTRPLWYALKAGGERLLVQTVTNLTGIPVSNFARIDFNMVCSLIDAIGGVNVTIPVPTTAFGFTFHAGVNHLTGLTAVYYSRDPSIDGYGRNLRQTVVVRAALTEISEGNLLSNPATKAKVADALTSALTADSDSQLTAGAIKSLVGLLRNQNNLAAPFVMTPTKIVGGQHVPNEAIADQLWQAVMHDSIAFFAARYPWTVVPAVVR